MSDADPLTWQTIATSLNVPSGTTFVGVLVAARETLSNSDSNEFDGHYVDQGQLMISTPEPATLSLLALGLGVAGVRKRRSRRYISSTSDGSQ
jgi:hypothetical protein